MEMYVSRSKENGRNWDPTVLWSLFWGRSQRGAHGGFGCRLGVIICWIVLRGFPRMRS